MKSIWDADVREEVTSRIRSLDDETKGRWGKMNVFQMLRHCILWDEMVLNNVRYKRPLIGILFGQFFLKKELSGDAPMRKNSPTIPDLIIRETSGNVAAEKQAWIALVNAYANYTLADYAFVHPFFGKMTREQLGRFVYRHTDHHLKQFGK